MWREQIVSFPPAVTGAGAHPLPSSDFLYLLDTNVISELRRQRPHGGVTAWIKAAAADDLHIAAVTLGEIQAGIEITREQDSAKATEIEAWADQIADAWNVLPMDAATFREW